MQEELTRGQRATDRVLVLRPIEGKRPLSSTGLVDTRLFTGANNLHAVMNQRTCLWNLKYDSGGLPDPLKQRFTSFDRLKQYADGYFRKRGIEIVEVID